MGESKWVVGFMAQHEVAPEGTVMERRDGARRSVADGRQTYTGWRVLVPPPEKKDWRRVMLEVSGEGETAQVRFPDGGVFEKGDLYVTPCIIARSAAPAPDRAKVAEMLDAWIDNEIHRGVVLDYVCGKEGE